MDIIMIATFGVLGLLSIGLIKWSDQVVTNKKEG